MAELPIAVDVPRDSGPTLPGANFLRAASGLPLVRQLTLLFAIAGSVALAIAAVLWMQSPDYRPLAGITTAYQANEVVQVLDSSGIAYRVDDRTGMVLVPQDSLYEARMKLAGASGIDGRQLGYELLDEDQGFGVSQFMEVARHRRSVEGELARSIATINAVESARVLLATPKSTAFLRDRRRPTASITVRLVSGHSLRPGQVKGITNLVAGAVPELQAQDVAVIDQTGKLLSIQDDDPALDQSERQLAYIAKIESQLQEKINNILLLTLGPDRYSAEVSAEVDFTRTEEAEELYNPDLVALRSEQRLEEESVGQSQMGGVPGTLTNQPPETAPDTPSVGDGDAVNRRSRSETTRNYEVDRTVSYTQHKVGSLTRLTVSVVVDDVGVADPQTGEVTQQSWSEAELERLATMVRNAVGYSASRGDTVSIVNRRFFAHAPVTVEATAFWAESWFTDLVKQVLGAVVLLVLVLGLLRPLFRNLSQAGEVVKERAAMAQSLALPSGSIDTDQAMALPSPAMERGQGQNGAMDYAAKMDTVRGLVEQDPSRVAEVVKSWVSDDE
jgi:flagellar M-ring protein FliF